MATAVGTNINLSALDKELEKLDKALDRFVKHSIDAQNKVNSAFNSMGQQGLKNFEDQLSRVQNKILEIGKKGVTMKWDSQNLARYIDQVNRLTEVLRQAKGAGFEFKTDNLNKDFQSISALMQELKIVKEWLTKGYKTTDSAGNVMYQQLSKDMQNYLVEYKKKLEDSLKFQNQSIMEQINNVRKALQVELKETEATEKKKAKVRQKANETYAGSIKYSNNAKTLEQERQAIANLEAAREKLKKTDADYATKLETLNKKINEHRINIEAATKTEAQRNALTSSTRAEYARLLAEQEKLRKSYLDLKSAQQVSGPTKENTAALQNIVKRYRDVYAEIQRYKQSANGQLDATERKFLAEQARLFAEAEKRKTDIARKEAIERSKITRTISVGSANKIISITDNAKSVNQHISAIKALENARNKLNNTDANYHSTLNRLNKKIKEHQTEIEKAKGKIDSFGRKQKDLINISGQLQNRLALLFSVSQLTGYVNKLIQVRGEFELQQRALQAIIQDTDEANKLWAKTVELAIHSPFRVKELVTYTKQLAAYRVEADKLYETNKMLADVSAGLGVDMNRLILAFGQVKAANYLRGTELRQFSEAGINILEELAKYFNEVEGKAVSVGDVFEMVSKRMVTFADVEQIFKRITSEGGTFYRMQEIQAETLQGQISNLWDSIDVMLNKIGKANDGILKGSVGAIRTLVENWEILANIAIPLLEAIIVRWGLMKANILISGKTLVGFFTNFNNQLKLTGILLTRGATAAKAFGRLKGINPFGGWATVISAAAAALFSLTSAVIEHERAVDNIIKKYKDLNIEVENVRETFSKATKNDDINKQRIALSKLLEVAKQDYDIDIDINVKELNEKEILDKFNEINQNIIERNAFALTFGVQFEKQKEWTITDDIQHDLEQLNKSYVNLSSSVNIYKSALYNSLEARQKAGEITASEAKALEKLSKDFDASSETQVQYTLRIIEAYKELNKVFELEHQQMAKEGASAKNFEGLFTRRNQYFKELGANAGIVTALLPDFIEKTEEASKEAAAFFDSIENEVNSLTDDKKEAYLKFAIDTHTAEKELGEFIREQLYIFANQRFEINITPTIKKIDENKELAEWAKRYNEYLDKIGNYEYLKEATTNDKESEFLSDLKTKLEQQEKITKAYLAGAELYTKAEYETADAKAKEYKLAIKFFEGVTKNTKEENEALKKLKSQIDLIKQMRQEFEKLNKTRDSVESLSLVTESFAEAAEAVGLNIKNIDVSTLQKQANAIRNLSDVSGGEAIKKRAIAEIEVQIGTDDLERENENIRKRIENMFSGYELSIELEKLNIPPDLAKQLFNVDIFNMTQLKEKLQEEIKKLRTMSTGQYAEDMSDEEKLLAQERLKIAEDTEKKISEMESDYIKNRAKKYVKYLQDVQSERVRIKLEELKQLKEVESMGEFSDEQKKTIKDSIRKETQQELDSQKWEDFKNTTMYTQMFSDLEYLGTKSIKTLKENLEGLKGSLSELPAADVKEIITQIEKLEEIEMERNPFAMLRESINEVNELQEQGRTRDFLENQISKSTNEINKTKKELEAIGLILGSSDRGALFSGENNELVEEYRHLLSLSNEELEKRRNILNKSISDEEKIAQRAGLDLETYNKLGKSTKKFVENVTGWGDAIANVLGSVDTLLDSLGVAEDDSSRLFLQSAQQIAQMVVQVVILTAALQAMGVAANTALGVIGWIAMALQAVAMLFASIFQASDKRKEKQIQRELDLVHELERAYNELNRAVEKGYSIELYKGSSERINNMKKQQEAYERMIEVEKDKKKTDHDRIQEWRDAILDLNNEIEDAYDDLRLELIGDFKSYSEDLADAMINALKAGEDGIAAWGEQVDEIIDNIVKKLLVTNFLEPKISELIDEYYSNLMPSTSSAEEARARYEKLQEEQLSLSKQMEDTSPMFEATKYLKLQAQYEKNQKELLAAQKEYEKALEASKNEVPTINKDATEDFEEGLKGLAEWFQSILPDWFLGNVANSDLSGLQRGIQGITEETAQILEAYLNSIRFFVADSNTQLRSIAAAFSDTDDNVNPMVAQLRIIAQQTTAINSLLEGVTKGGHSEGGRGIKVFIS